jgi:hypothetical protein
MHITKHRLLTNAELLQQLSDKRFYSDIIEELCQRIESLAGTCPVCDADLELARKDLPS